METVARLNELASQTPLTNRKRLRSSDAQDATPAKRRALENETQKQTPVTVQSSSRRSTTRLRSRPSLPVTTPAPKQRRANVYDVQESPAKSREDQGSIEKLQAKKKVTKKKRLLNRKEDKKSTNTRGFDKRRQSAFNPLTVAGVTLSTSDSPAKNTRARRELPLKKLDTNYLKVVPVDADPNKQASPELGLDNPREVPFTSGQSEEACGVIESKGDGEKSSQGHEVQESDRDSAANIEKDHAVDHHEDASRTVIVGGSEKVGHGSSWRQTLTDQDINYLRRTYEDDTREPRRRTKESKPKPQQSASQIQPNKNIEKERNADARPRSPREELEEEEHAEMDEMAESMDDAGAGEAPVEPKQRKSRPKMSEEERRAKKEAEAQRRQENAIETEAAETRNFDVRGKDFVEDIEDLVMQAGGLDAWSKMGAGAKTITAMVAKKTKMDGARAETLWRKLSALRDIFFGSEEATEERVDHLVHSLQAKSTWQVLTRDGEIKPGDTTVIDLYEQLIPQSVYVLKEQLRGRFVAAHTVSWQELLSLTEIAISLCDVAADWEYKPTNLETGIRKQVRQNIRPSLVSVRNVVKDTTTRMEYGDRKQRELEAFTRRQEMKREEKRRMLELKSHQYTSHQSPGPAGLVWSQAGSQQALENPEPAGDNYSTHVQQPPSNSTNRTPFPPPLRRHPTEEIPAPDPNTTWSEEENIALLNGLQEYLGDDRYTKILRDSRFGRVLRGKDVDQCMTRAVFFQTGCRQILKEKAENRDSSFDWLRVV